MKKQVSITMDKEVLRILETEPLVRDCGRSAFVRHCVTEFMERKGTEKRENENSKEGEK